MGDHQNGGFLFAPNRQEFLVEFFLGDGIKGAEGLIEHEYGWIHRQSPGDGHSLLHAPGDLPRFLVGRFTEVNHLQVMVHHPLAASCIELGSGSLHCQIDVLPDRFPRQQ